MTEDVIKPGSVIREPGHLLIHKYSLHPVSLSKGVFRFSLYGVFIHKPVNYTQMLTFRGSFHIDEQSNTMYYVDRRGSVWETDIVNKDDVRFYPSCLELGKGFVMFRKLTKLECLFM